MKSSDLSSHAIIELECICGSKLVLERFGVSDSLILAQTWWGGHIPCKPKGDRK